MHSESFGAGSLTFVMPDEQSPFFEIRDSPIQGKGGYATHHIPAGTRLIEYAGERITPAESDASRNVISREASHALNRRATYLD